MDFKPLGKKKCYACIQWDGTRVVEKLGIKVDIGSEGTCLLHHKKVKGSYYCAEFFPLK
jgi:hypothetical protein